MERGQRAYVGGALTLYYSNGSSGGSAGNAGLNLEVGSGQTAGVVLDTTTTSSLRLNAITMDPGAAAFTLGNSANAVPFAITLGGAAGTPTWTNNSSNPFTVNSNAYFGGGGGGNQTITFSGVGNFVCNNSFTPTPSNGAAFTLATNTTGNVTLAGLRTVSYVNAANDSGVSTLNVVPGALLTAAGSGGSAFGA